MTTTTGTSHAQPPKASRPDLRLVFRTQDVTAQFHRPLLTAHADIAQWAALNQDGTVRTAADEQRGTPPGGSGLRSCCWTSRWDGLAGEWDAFALTAQAEARHDWYGWRAEFREPFAVGLDRAEAMVGVLRRVDKRLRSAVGQYGEPGGLAEWAARVLAAAGAGSTPRPFGRRTGPAHEPDGSGCQWMDTDGLRRWLDGELAAFRRAHGCDPG